VANTWTKRQINIKSQDPDNIVSLSADEFTLDAGKYLVRWNAPSVAYLSAPRTRHRLWNLTDGSLVALGSSQSYQSGSSANTGNTMEHGAAVLSMAVAKTYCIQYYCTTSYPGDLGVHDGLALGIEVYTSIEIVRLG
ncbi:MAG: hypothetical protein KIT16_10435, partial [Rhodospirillaceae bacterium]|nr:hypothetical protein [Rhodospirillaceae bacterium]